MAISSPRKFWMVTSLTEEMKTVANPSTIRFAWECGMSKTVLQRNIITWHKAIKTRYAKTPLRIADISRASTNPLGVRLSAWNLTYNHKGKQIPVECIYHGSKVFMYGGPNHQYYDMAPGDVVKDLKEKTPSYGSIVEFNFDGTIYPSYPMSSFYDWIYCQALKEHWSEFKDLLNYDVFTDIRLKETSLACQAEACAIYVSLIKTGLEEEAMKSYESFVEVVFGVKIKKEEEPEEQTDAYQVGQKVRHPRFGEGTISEIDEEMITIIFTNPAFGKKSLKKDFVINNNLLELI